MDERIDAFLADLEAAQTWRDRHVRRGELGDEVAAQAAEKSLLDRLRGALGSEVRVTTESREITGRAVFLGAGILVLDGPVCSIIVLASVFEIRLSSRRHLAGGDVLERLGLSSALRRLSAEHAEILVELRASRGTIRGFADLVAADYLEIAGRIIPLSRISLVQARVNPFA